MYFCSQFFDGLNFDPVGISPCCPTNNEHVPHFQFSGGTFPFERYQTHILRALKYLQAESRFFCRTCSRGKLQKLKGNDLEIDAPFIFKTILLNQNRLCNARCTYCDYWKESGGSYPILEILKDLHAQNALSPDCNICWGGGEPSILPEFEEANAWLRQQKYQQFVHTNAIHISPAIASMLASEQGSIQVSLDSATPETFYAVKGVKKFDQTIENIKKYVSDSIVSNAVIIKYIILPENSSTMEFMFFFELCSQIGITQIQYSLNFHTVPEISTGMAHAAAKFITLAKRFPTITCSPFFVPAHILKKINSITHAA
jgi:sulfatase maturation enzyme AslB (radical SAM superfamily)